MKQPRLSRREMLENCIVKGGLVAGVPMSAGNLLALWQKTEAQAHKTTPTEVLGPFYKKGAPHTADMRIADDPGFPLRVSGKVYNTRGDKVPGAKVELWHADHRGRYDVQGYRYRAGVLVEAASEYKVETIMPGHYDDRPAQHIHYMISAPGHKTLITQVYFATDPFFEGNPDKHWGKRGIVSNRELVLPVLLYEENNGARSGVQFDIVLERA